MAVAQSVVTRLLIIAAAVLLAAGGGAAWWIASAEDPVTTDAIGDSVQTRARGQLPVFAVGPREQALYKFAVERPDILTFIPCVCGCVDFKHTSNRSCYVKDETADKITYTSHAVG
jgi:hypothetical protein